MNLRLLFEDRMIIILTKYINFIIIGRNPITICNNYLFWILYSRMVFFVYIISSEYDLKISRNINGF